MRLAILLGSLFLLAFVLNAHAGSVDIPGGGGLGSLNLKTMSMKERQYRFTSRQKLDYSCGSAALSTLLTHHYGDAVDEDTIYEAMWKAGDHEKIRKEGFSMLDMKKFLKSRGYKAEGFFASLDRLAKVSLPAIVLLRDGGYNHFVVVKGIRDGEVAYGDPALGAKVVPRDQFEKMMANRIVFVIEGRNERVVFNDPKDWRVREKAPIDASSGPGDMANVTLLRRLQGDF